MAVQEKCVLWIFVLIQGLLLHSNAQTTSNVPASTQAVPVMNVNSMIEYPFMYMKDGSYVGYVPELLQQVADIMNVDVSIKEPADQVYGTKDVNGTWSGLVGAVIKDDNVDLVGPLTITKARMADVTFSYPIMCIRSAIVMHRPDSNKPPLKESLTRLLYPLEFPVWLMVVLSFLVTGTVLYIISHFNPYEWRRMAKDKEATIREAESFTCLNSFWFVISALAWQGYVRAPRSMGGRITVTAWWFFVIIFILSYTASLTNYLRVGPDPYEAEGYSKIKSFEDLADNDNVKIGLIPSGATEARFAMSKQEVEQRIYNKVIASRSEVDYKTNADGIKYLRSKDYSDVALIMESTAAKYYVNRKPCDLYMISDHSVSSFLGFAVRNATIGNMFNHALLILQEQGKINMLEKKWFKSQCAKTEYLSSPDDKYIEAAFYQLDLGTFSGALLILTFGIVFGGIVSLIEYCIYKFAESPVDEGEENLKPSPNPNRQSAILEADQNEHLLPSEIKRGGATQV